MGGDRAGSHPLLVRAPDSDVATRGFPVPGVVCGGQGTGWVPAVRATPLTRPRGRPESLQPPSTGPRHTGAQTQGHAAGGAIPRSTGLCLELRGLGSVGLFLAWS